MFRISPRAARLATFQAALGLVVVSLWGAAGCAAGTQGNDAGQSTPDAGVVDAGGGQDASLVSDAASDTGAPDAASDAAWYDADPNPDSAVTEAGLLDAAHPGVVPGVQAVGLVPSPRLVLDAGLPGANNGETEAEFEVLALGSRAVWFEVLPSSALGLSKLAQREGIYRETGVRLLVNIPLRDVVREPFPSEEELEAQTTVYRALLDSIFAAPVQADYLTFGSGLDVGFAALTAEEQATFQDWMTELLGYAKEARPTPSLRVGVSGSARGWLQPTQEFSRLADIGEVAAASWLVVATDGRALPPADAIAQLDLLVAAADAKHIPLVLQDVGYPSSTEVESSEAQQAAFFAAFFEQLARYPQRLPYVSLSALNEYVDSACDSYADTFGLPPAAAVARCSVGLRRRDATEKPAYQTVAEGLVRFSSL